MALTLRMVAGLTVPEIARAFLVPETTVGRRITRAKAKIKAARIPYRVPSAGDLPARVGGVLAVLFLVFNEGYLATGPATYPVRHDLTAEAIRLTRLIRALLPEDGEVAGLLALMLLTEARRTAWDLPDVAKAAHKVVQEAQAAGAPFSPRGQNLGCAGRSDAFATDAAIIGSIADCVLKSNGDLEAGVSIADTGAPCLVADQPICGDAVPTLERLDRCGRAGVEHARDRFRCDLPAARRLLSQYALDPSDRVTLRPKAQQGHRWGRWELGPGARPGNAVNVEASGSLHRADSHPGLLPEAPIDTHVLTGTAKCALETANLPALIADLEHRVPLQRGSISGRLLRSGPADMILPEQAQHLDVQPVDKAAQPGHPVAEPGYLDMLVSLGRGHPHDLLKGPARGGEALVDLPAQHLPDRRAEVGFDEGKVAVEIVVPLGKNVAVGDPGRSQPLPITRTDGQVPRCPVQTPHPVQSPVEKLADLLERLQCLLVFLIPALHLMLVRPGPALEHVTEDSANHAGQHEPYDEE